MDNRKIGKLIAELRRKQGLTQQELGDKVGVGFRAVSKWERGLTLPDISIINDVSKILGISSDELLKGEITNKEKPTRKKVSNKLKITITVMLGIFLIVAGLLIYFNNRTYAYNLYSSNMEQYFVEGEALFVKNKISVIISKINFKDEKLNSTIIKNYEYDILFNDEIIFRYGYLDATSNLDDLVSIFEFLETFNINYNNNNVVVKNEDKSDESLSLIMRFITEDNEEIVKKVDLVLSEK